MDLVTLYRPVGPSELALIEASGWREFPPRLPAEFAARYPPQKVGSLIHTELWVPAEELSQFNKNIVGFIEVIAEFR